MKKRKILRLSAVFLFALTAAFASALCVNADTDVPQDGGYYTVSDAEGRCLSLSEDGVCKAETAESEQTMLRAELRDDGGYGLCSAAYGARLYYSDIAGIHTEPTEDSSELRLRGCVEHGDHFLCAERDGAEVYFAFTAGEDGGMLLTVTSEPACGWRAELCRPQKMTLSMNTVKTRPYVAYTDLRVVTEPAYFAKYTEWDSSDRRVLVVDDNGDFCALTEGDVVITVRFGDTVLTCEVNVSNDNRFAWYSQNNVSTGGWNGDALSGLYYIGDGMKKRCAANNSTKKTDWMSEGCSLCSIAQVLNNMGARYTDGYDFRSGISGNIMADPYTVALANLGHKGPEQGNVTLYGDPIMTRHNAIAAAFNVKGKTVTVKQKYAVTKKAIKEALDECPWGVIVCFENKAYGTHYITFNRCLNPDAETPNDYIFTISDPAAVEPTIASDTVFEESYAYKVLHYRLGQAQLMQIWSYEK